MLFDYKRFILQEKLLLENRIQDLKNKYSDIDPVVVDYFEKNDPTPNNAYFEWLLKAYDLLDNVEYERLEEMKRPAYQTFIEFIKKYDKLKPKLTGEHADINNYRRILQLYSVIESNMGVDYSNSEIKKMGKVDILVNNYEWLIFTPYSLKFSSPPVSLR